MGFRAYSRCIGHGGMPVERGSTVKRNRHLQFYDDRSYDPQTHQIVAQETEFGVNGYALLEFARAKLTITYRDISGKNLVRETWSTIQGNVDPVGKPVFDPSVQVSGDGRIILRASQNAGNASEARR
jgi:hypothetical protein